jgi:hypothetical protein
MSVITEKKMPCLSGKVIPAQFVQITHASKAKSASRVVLASPAASEDAQQKPKITLIKEGETVKAIEIQCACGAVIHLDCEY